jgi:Methyltransferase domain
VTVIDHLSRRAATRPALARRLRAVYLLARRALSRLGLELLLSSYDSPIPQPRALRDGYLEAARPLPGVELDTERALSFLREELGPLLRDWREPPGFSLDNGTYESVDAETLHAMVRRFSPRHVVELGSGYSSLIIADALARNGSGAEHRCLDPYPSPLLPSGRVEPIAAQDLEPAMLAHLQEDDILFVDTSHTVKVGGDVNAIVLELLPQLSPGVLVHFHDIFLPYSYSRGHLESGHFWSEQYLLQAFLIGNHDWQVVLPNYAVARAHPAELAAAVPSFRPGVAPGAFWIRRR